jgi:hypothetical protein
MLSELLSCHAGCNVEHFLQNGFPTVFCEVMGTGSWDRRVHIVYEYRYRGIMIFLLGEPAAIQITNFGCSEAHGQWLATSRFEGRFEGRLPVGPAIRPTLYMLGCGRGIRKSWFTYDSPGNETVSRVCS